MGINVFMYVKAGLYVIFCSIFRKCIKLYRLLLLLCKSLSFATYNYFISNISVQLLNYIKCKG